MSENKTRIEPASDELLAKLDFIVVIDHSGSTSADSKKLKGKTRYQEMQEECMNIARAAAKFDSDGITVIHFSNHATLKDNVKAEEVENVFKEFRPNGSTNLADALKLAIDHAAKSSKETVVFVFTDGEADDENAVLAELNRAGRSLGRPRIGFCLIQIGDDSSATRFLDFLDNNLKVDVSAHFSEEEAEDISFEQLVTAARTE